MSVEPHPKWKPDDKSDRHPQALVEWDYRTDPVGGAFERSRRRLNVASDYDDPRAPDQMALVLRLDVMRLMHQYVHRNAAFEAWVRCDADGFAPMETAPKDATWVLLRLPNKRVGAPQHRLVVAHWADGGGDDQPRFKGWFTDDGYNFRAVVDEPDGWMPLPVKAKID